MYIHKTTFSVQVYGTKHRTHIEPICRDRTHIGPILACVLGPWHGTQPELPQQGIFYYGMAHSPNFASRAYFTTVCVI